MENEELELREDIENKKEEENILELKDKEIEDLKLKISEWEKEYARKLADFENYRKRKDKELEEFKKYACEKLILKQIEQIDVLKMAIESANTTNDIDALLTGVKMVVENMKDILQSEGLEEIESIGKTYDPVLHHAVNTMSNEEKEDDIVLQEYRKGYKLKGKVIRPAMVIINKK